MEQTSREAATRNESNIETSATPLSDAAARRRRRLLWLVPAALFVAGMCVFHGAMIFSGMKLVQANPYDTRHIHYLLEHSWAWLTRMPAHESLWSPPFFYPAPNVLAFSETMLGMAPFYWIWRAVGLAPDTSMQMWMMTLSTLNFAVALFFLVKALRLHVVAASFGAFLFTFASSRACQLGHQHLLGQFFVVLFIWGLFGVFSEDPESTPRSRRRWIWVLALVGVAQVYAGFHYAAFLMLALIVAVARALIGRRTRPVLVARVRENFWTLLASGVVAAALLAPLAWHYLEAGVALGLRQATDYRIFLPRPESWIYMGWRNWIYARAMSHMDVASMSFSWEQAIGLGFVTTVVTIVTMLWRRKIPWVYLMLVTACWLVVLSTMWPGEHSLWKYVYGALPPMRAIRAVARIGLMLTIPAMIALALAMDGMWARRRYWAAILIGALCCAEQLQWVPGYDKYPVREGVRRVEQAVAASKAPAFFVSDESLEQLPCITAQLDGMWATFATGKPMVSGYSSCFPRGWPERFWGPARLRPVTQQDTERYLKVWMTLQGRPDVDVAIIPHP